MKAPGNYYENEQEPIAVDMWYAHSCNSKRRDFRLLNLDKPCECGVVAKGLCLNLKIFWSRERLVDWPLTIKLQGTA